jgi:hypothetical protein
LIYEKNLRLKISCEGPFKFSFLISFWLIATVHSKRTTTTTTTSGQDKFLSLWQLSNQLSNGKFVKNISIYPSLQVTLVHPDMTREFENICKILYSERCPGDLSEETMKLFYDHTFEIGKEAY